MSIYTRKGDDGTTGLLGGKRVKKNNLLIGAIGSVDELNGCLGLVISLLPKSQIDIKNQLENIQTELMRLNANLANPTNSQIIINKKPFPPTIIPNPPGQKEIDSLENQIDKFDQELPKLTNFILPGGSPAGASCHLARTICRRAEREIVHIAIATSTHSKYLNRLSDYLFTVARIINHRSKYEETIWKNK